MKIYYHNDLDGRCAGAIAYRANREAYPNIELIEIDYKDEVDIKEIKLREKIIIVDFSFKPEVMEEVLNKTHNVIWIDHHKTAFEYKYSQELKGLRDNAYSGCELAWKYFYPDIKMPRIVELIGDRDTWQWKFKKETAYFNLGLMLHSHQPESHNWDSYFKEGPDPSLYDSLLSETIKEGKICLQFRDNFCEDYCKSYGFETKFEGYKCFALGLYMFGSEAFGDRMKLYDICLSFAYLGDNWMVGLYSDEKNIDTGKIAQKYGGGGHKGASGFVCDELPFMKTN